MYPFLPTNLNIYPHVPHLALNSLIISVVFLKVTHT
mgnify:CR=1 FL=1